MAASGCLCEQFGIGRSSDGKIIPTSNSFNLTYNTEMTNPKRQTNPVQKLTRRESNLDN